MTTNEDPWLATQEESPARPPYVLRPPPEPGTTVLLLSGPIDRADIPALCSRAGEVLEKCNSDPVVCDVGALTDPDAGTVDALARLQLTARRLGRRVQLRRACGELQDLLVLMGLSDVLPCGAGSILEPGRQAEQREQPRRVEEERDPGDPVA